MEYNHKNDFRKSSIKRLKFVSHKAKYYKSKIVVRQIEQIISIYKCKNILLYIPLDIEVDIKPLIKKLRIKKVNIYVPFMIGDSFKIVKYRLPLYKKSFKIKEPNNSFCIVPKLDLAVIPIVGVDARAKRVGFGKGMYDRFFYNLTYEPVMVFTQLELCKSEQILSNDYDIQADYIITG